MKTTQSDRVGQWLDESIKAFKDAAKEAAPMTTKPEASATAQGAQILVLAWMTMDGIRETGKLIRRDLNWIAETEAAPLAKACVWSRDMARRAAGEAYAATEGMRLLVMTDADDVLSKARAAISKATEGRI